MLYTQVKWSETPRRSDFTSVKKTEVKIHSGVKKSKKDVYLKFRWSEHKFRNLNEGFQLEK